MKSRSVKKVTPKASDAPRPAKAVSAKNATINRAEKIVSDYRKLISKKIINDCRKLISEKNLAYTKLAFQPAEDRIYMWAEIAEDDLRAKGMFYLAVAEVNGRFSQKTPLCLDAMVVNKRHGLAIPDMYNYYVEVRK